MDLKDKVRSGRAAQELIKAGVEKDSKRSYTKRPGVEAL